MVKERRMQERRKLDDEKEKGKQRLKLESEMEKEEEGGEETSLNRREIGK